MRSAVVLCALLACLSFALGSDVVILTQENFKEQTSQGAWLIEYFAPWCGHCKHLAPTWEKLATAVKGETNVGSVDCTVHKEICTKFGVRGYPTIKLVRDGKAFDYSGHRTLEAFTAFAKEGYAKAASNPLPAEYATASKKAEKAEDEDVPEVEDDEVAQVIALNDDDFAQVKTGIWFVKFYAPWCGHCKNLIPTWDSLSTKSDGKFKVAKVDCTVNRKTCSDYAVRGYPTLKLMRDGKAFAYSGPRTEAAFLSFAENGYKNAESMTIPGFVAPEPKEETNQEAAGEPEKEVVVLTEATFDEKTASGEWFVEFYAPWCGHCKNLVPIWDAFAKQAKVNVAKVDCTVEKSLMTRYGVRGFPTLKFIKDGKVYDYRGQRSVEGFLAFAEGNGYAATTPTDKPKSAAGAKDEL